MTRLADLLPAVFAEDQLTRRLVDLFDELLESVAERAESAGDYFDPNLAPAAFLRMLGAWAMLRAPAQADDDELRSLLRDGLPLLRRRGTRIAIEQLLRLALGCDVEVIDPTTVSRPARTPDTVDVPVVVPVIVRVRGWEHRWSFSDVAEAVASEMPASCHYLIDLTDKVEA